MDRRSFLRGLGVAPIAVAAVGVTGTRVVRGIDAVEISAPSVGYGVSNCAVQCTAVVTSPVDVRIQRAILEAARPLSPYWTKK